MSRALEELLVVSPTPLCDMVPDRGTHKAKAAFRVQLNRPGKVETPQEANICKPHIEPFRTRARNAGYTFKIVRYYTKEVAK